MSKFKVGDKVRVVRGDTPWGLLQGEIYTVNYVHPKGNIQLLTTGLVLWHSNRFELVLDVSILTPEEVFEHLRKGTWLQLQNSHSGKWYDVVAPEYVGYGEITTKQWRVKPKLEVIELNGKRYKLIEE